MTLIAFQTHGDHAELITDTTSYTVNGSRLGQCSKLLPLPHMDALIAAQGDSSFGDQAKMVLWQAAAQVATFDDLAEGAPGWLRECWEFEKPSGDAFVLLLGYSPAQGRFTAHLFASEHDFNGQQIEGAWAHPMPFTAQITDLEADRLRRHDGSDSVREALETWNTKPPLPDHNGPDEWTHLGVTIRQQRALTEYARVFVAGSLHYTRLDRGRVITAKVHEFDDQGEEFLRMIQWTFHPIAQLMECHCGSGDTFLACHLAPLMDEPCTCGTSGRALRECCAVAS